METLVFDNLKEEYEQKKEILQKTISQLVDKDYRKDTKMIESLEVATAQYNLAAKLYQDSIKKNSNKS